MTKLKQFAVPLPPLQEQKAIVTTVNALIQQIETLEQKGLARQALNRKLALASLNSLREAEPGAELRDAFAFLLVQAGTLFGEVENVKELRATLLELAVQGKLTAKWRLENPEVEPAKVLLQRIKVEKARLVKEKIAKKFKELHPKSKNKPSGRVPGNWEWKRFHELIWCFRGHNPPKSEFAYEPKPGYVRFVQITDFKTDSRAVYVQDSPKLKKVYKGEIIIAAYRHIGKLSRKMEGAFNVALCKVMNIPPFSRDFLELLIGSSMVKGELLAASERGHIPSMHSSHLLSLWVPVPPLLEQDAIVSQVNELMNLCDQLETQANSAKETIQKLMNAIVGQAM